eukprot:scaffold88941_cov48-Phaeocystis_antarctica.AAC.3
MDPNPNPNPTTTTTTHRLAEERWVLRRQLLVVGQRGHRRDVPLPCVVGRSVSRQSVGRQQVGSQHVLLLQLPLEA